MIEYYTGDIYMITNINKEILNFLKNYDIIDEDYLIACKYVLAKKDAKLIKIDDNYIDVDSLKTPNDIKIICELLNNGDTNNVLKSYVYNPFIGKLFVKNIKKEKVKKLQYSN